LRWVDSSDSRLSLGCIQAPPLLDGNLQLLFRTSFTQPMEQIPFLAIAEIKHIVHNPTQRCEQKFN